MRISDWSSDVCSSDLQGLLDEAVAKINEVRARAGAALLNSNAATAVAGQEDLRERIRNERRIEFTGEGINYFDELRWKTWEENVFRSGNGKTQIWGTNVSAYSYKGDFLYTWRSEEHPSELQSILRT